MIQLSSDEIGRINRMARAREVARQAFFVLAVGAWMLLMWAAIK